MLRQIEHFFSIYKDLEGKKTEIAGWKGANVARKMIVEAAKRLAADKR
ncbi:MAG TPA: inorganic diphosphatase [Candidatus Angelobacter sp.]